MLHKQLGSFDLIQSSLDHLLIAVAPRAVFRDERRQPSVKFALFIAPNQR